MSSHRFGVVGNPFRTIWDNRGLIKLFVFRDFQGRFQGSFLGVVWYLLTPLLLLLLYSFVFSTVFRVRWGEGENSSSEFVLALYLGLLQFNFFSECISKGPSLIIAQSNFVKKIVFPLEILPCITVFSTLLYGALGFIVWVLVHLIFLGALPLTALLYPLILIPLLLFTLGVAWFLASLGVFIRDLSHIVGFICSALMFLSPLFFPVASFPERFRFLLYFNPLTPAIEQSRDVLLWGNLPDLRVTFFSWAVSTLIAALGFVWFVRTKKGFFDVI